MTLLQRIFQQGNLHLALALIRLWVGAMMAYHGWQKMSDGGVMFVQNVSQKMGYPEFLAWCAIGAELVGGILLAIGFLTRPAALFIVITMAVAVFGVHMNDPWGKKEFALAYLIPALAFFISGGGNYSVDARLERNSQ